MCLNTYFLESEIARGVTDGVDKGVTDGVDKGVADEVETTGLAVEVLANPIGNADDERIGVEVGVRIGVEALSLSLSLSYHYQ